VTLEHFDVWSPSVGTTEWNQLPAEPANAETEDRASASTKTQCVGGGGTGDGLIRLSVGIEHVQDLLEDLKRGLGR